MFGGSKPDLSLLKMSEVEQQESRLNTYKAPAVLDQHRDSVLAPGDDHQNDRSGEVRQSESQLLRAQDVIRISTENPHLTTGLDRLRTLEM